LRIVIVARAGARDWIKRWRWIQIEGSDHTTGIPELQDTNPQSIRRHQSLKYRLRKEVTLFLMQEEKGSILPDRPPIRPP